MSSEEDVHGIVADLYAGTLDSATWSRGMIALADLTGASGAHLIGLNPLTGVVLREEAHRLDPALVRAYREDWSTRDILLAPALRIPVGEPTPDYQLTSRGAWEASALFNELALPFDCPYALPTIIHKSADKLLALSFKASRRHGPFHLHEAARLKAFIPHLRRALLIKDRLERAEIHAANLARSLDNTSFGVVVLDSCAKIIEVNAVASKLMGFYSGVSRDHEGRLVLREPAGSELHRWILAGSAPQKNGDGLLHVPRASSPPLSILVMPLPRKVTSWVTGDPRWMLLLFDPDRRIRLSIELIALDLGISVREAEVAALLVEGCDLKTVSDRLNVSLHTVRTHVKSIFAKSGIHSQTELIRRIANGPAAIESRASDPSA
jgi:DNA-binding CsgD family transcriptional regulator/PAS domain-containing protein